MASTSLLRIGLRIVSSAVLRRPVAASVTSCRLWSTLPALQAGQKDRLSRGEAPDGIAYGPLTDLPDWSYIDGTPAPETTRRRRRQLRRLDVAHQISTYLQEVDNAVKKKDKEGNILETTNERSKKKNHTSEQSRTQKRS